MLPAADMNGDTKTAESSGNSIGETLKSLGINLDLAPVADVNTNPNNPVIGDIAMNFSANALGLANAATPMGIKAMQGLQKINKDKNSASNSMCTLLAMNTAGFQLIPATVLAILAANGCKNPTEIIVPTLIVTSVAFVSAIVMARLFQTVFPPQKVEMEDKNV